MAVFTVSLQQASGVGDVSLGDGATLATLAVSAGRGPKGDGFTGGTYDAGTGKVTFTSNDGIGFETGDLRGDLTEPGPIGSVTPNTGAFTSLSTTGDAVVGGNLTVEGTTTTVDSTTVAVGDKNIELAKDATTPAEADGGGITLTGASATITYSSANDYWALNKGLNVSGNVSLSGTVDGRDVAADGTKLDGIESGATADQTAGEIKTAYESNADTNAFTDAEQSKLSGIEAGAEVNAVDSVNTQTGAVVLDADDIDDSTTTNKFTTAADISKLSGIEAGADVTDTTNVTAAGALMDSELTSEASVKALDQGVATTDSPDFAGLTVDTDTLYVDSANNRVGIGTSSPVSTLTLPNDGMIGWASTACNIQATSSGPDYIKFSTSSSEAMRIDSSGNVGIGTSSPEVSLHLDDSSADQKLRVNSAGSTYIELEGKSGLGVIRATNEATVGSLAFETGSTPSEAVRIDSSGNVGIGTSSPGYPLDVGGASRADALWFRANTATAPTSTGGFYRPFLGAVAYGFNGSEAMRIDSSGNMLIGTTTNLGPSENTNTGFTYYSTGALVSARTSSFANMYLNKVGAVNGDVARFYRNGVEVGSISVTASGTSYNSPSDERLKENIADAQPASDLIDGIQVREFDWKADGEHQRYGMVAQELETVAAEAVTKGESEDDMWAVDYSKLVPMLVKEIQDLRKRVAELENTQ